MALMKVFPNELENQKDFDAFTEWLQTFELYRGKQGEEEFQDEARVVGKFKVRNNLIRMHSLVNNYFLFILFFSTLPLYTC